jgi:hypothetical protein
MKLFHIGSMVLPLSLVLTAPQHARHHRPPTLTKRFISLTHYRRCNSICPLNESGNDDALSRLVSLAETMREFHDTPPGYKRSGE